MKISFCNLSEAKILTEFYNDQFANLPYCHPVSTEAFEVGIRCRQSKRGNKWVKRSYEDLSQEKLIVASQDDEVIGFAHVAKWCGDLDQAHWLGLTPLQGILHRQVGLIRFFHYRQGHRSAGQAIIEAAEDYFRKLGLSQIRAFSYYGYRFHRFCHAFLSDRVGQVRSLLGMNGYRTTRGLILLHLPNFQVSEPTSPDPQIKVQVQHKSGDGNLQNIRIKLMRKRKEIGDSYSISGGHFCRGSTAQDVFYVAWFFIDKQEQGRGLGRYMMRYLLWELQNSGYKTATLHVDTGNARAQLLYTNLGFQTVDTNYQFFKDMRRKLPSSIFKKVGF